MVNWSKSTAVAPWTPASRESWLRLLNFDLSLGWRDEVERSSSRGGSTTLPRVPMCRSREFAGNDPHLQEVRIGQHPDVAFGANIPRQRRHDD